MVNKKGFMITGLTGVLALISASYAFANAPVQSIPIGAIDTSGMTTTQRITRIENQMQYLTGLTQQVKQQQQQIADLTGQVEALQHQIGKLVENQKALSIMDQRLVQLETMQKLSQTSKASDASVNQKDVSKEESQAYNKAFDNLMNKQYTDAVQGFQNFVKTYPKSSLLGNAYYWLGELYLVQGQPDKASQQFRLVISNPENTKTPDAMFKLGSIFLAFGDAAHAKEMFQKLVKQYPGTNAANLAKERLKTLE